MSHHKDETSARKSLEWLYNGNEEAIKKVMADIRDYQKKKSPNESSDESIQPSSRFPSK
jgi:hypothetical protein